MRTIPHHADMLGEIAQLTVDGVSVEELAGMMRLRRTEAERQAHDERRRLERMAARIQLVNGEHTIETTAIVIEPLDPMHRATTSHPADGFDVDVAPIFERLDTTLFGALEDAGTGTRDEWVTELQFVLES